MNAQVAYLEKGQGTETLKVQSMDPQVILQMIRDYRDRRYNPVRGGGPYSQMRRPLHKEESRSCWFSKSIFLNTLLNDPKIDGFRMYFGVHSQKSTSNPDYVNCQTLIICPTVASQDNDEKYVFYAGFIPAPSNDTSTASDGGSLCPPPGTCRGCTLLDAADMG